MVQGKGKEKNMLSLIAKKWTYKYAFLFLDKTVTLSYWAASAHFANQNILNALLLKY